MHKRFIEINGAFTGLVNDLHRGQIPNTRTTSRVGYVLQVTEPMTVTYLNPWQRVLLNQYRDANPFFHLYESLWMLAGRNDVKPLNYYSSKYSEFCSDDGVTTNGAYGYRWRHSWAETNHRSPSTTGHGVDQLDELVDHLKANPNSRRAVLAMWNVEDDLLKVDTSKDVCCNTHIYFSLRVADEIKTIGWVPHGEYKNWTEHPMNYRLDMTVCNRSNDMILGMLGANVVHFSFLQEYMAIALGVGVGVYNQFTNNLHVYCNNWKPQEWLKDQINRDAYSPRQWSYERDVKTIQPLYEGNRDLFDEECKKFVSNNEDNRWIEQTNCLRVPLKYTSSQFLTETAQPMMDAFHCHKLREYDLATQYINSVKSDDWRIAGQLWLIKRRTQYEKQTLTQQSQVSLEPSSE